MAGAEIAFAVDAEDWWRAAVAAAGPLVLSGLIWSIYTSNTRISTRWQSFWDIDAEKRGCPGVD
jgi:hypothetical protein